MGLEPNVSLLVHLPIKQKMINLWGQKSCHFGDLSPMKAYKYIHIYMYIYIYNTQLKELIGETLIGKRFGKNKKLKKSSFRFP